MVVRQRLTLLGSLFALSLPAFPAGAQTEQERNAARDLAVEGKKAAEAGNHTKAEDLYRRAYALFPAPTISVRLARELVALGRLVEGEELYRLTTRTPITDESSEPFRAAVAVAKVELEELLPRIPNLKIIVKGAESEKVSVTRNDLPVAPALVGVVHNVNPGSHELVARLDGREAKQTLELAEGESKTVELVLSPKPNEPTSRAAPAPPNGPPPSRASEQSADAGAGDGQRTWAYVAGGFGVLGLGVGVVTGLMATSAHSDAEKSCPASACRRGSDGEDSVDTFRSLRTVSTVGYIVGALGLGAGVTLYLTAPEDPGPTALRLHPQGVSLEGHF